MKRFISSKRKLLNNQAGSVATIMALAAVPALFGAGVAVETGRANMADARLDDAADAAVLCATRNYEDLMRQDPFKAEQHKQTAIANCLNTFNANIKGQGIDSPTIDITLTNEGVFQASARGNVPQILGKLMGKDKVEIDANACGSMDDIRKKANLAECKGVPSCTPKIQKREEVKKAACGQIGTHTTIIEDVACKSYEHRQVAQLPNDCGGTAKVSTYLGPNKGECLVLQKTRSDRAAGKQIIFNANAVPACAKPLVETLNVEVDEENKMEASQNAGTILDELAALFGLTQIDLPFELDKNCKAEESSLSSDKCDVILVQSFSPISLLLSDSVDWKQLAKPVAFPLNPDSEEELMYDWYASAATPLLVTDPLRKGSITNATQLFGNSTWGKSWENGYEALATLDKDSDGKVAGDELTSLGLWFDNNRNGISETGEVRYFDSLPIVALYYGVSEVSNTKPVYYYAERGFDIRNADGSIETRPSVDWTSVGYTKEQVAAAQAAAQEAALKAAQAAASSASASGGSSSLSTSSSSSAGSNGEQTGTASSGGSSRDSANAGASSSGGGSKASAGGYGGGSAGGSGGSSGQGGSSAAANKNASNSANPGAEGSKNSASSASSPKRPSSSQTASTASPSSKDKVKPIGIAGDWLFCLGSTGECNRDSADVDAFFRIKQSDARWAEGKFITSYIKGSPLPTDFSIDDPALGLDIHVKLVDRLPDGSEKYEMMTLSRFRMGDTTTAEVKYDSKKDMLVGRNVDKDGETTIDWRAARAK